MTDSGWIAGALVLGFAIGALVVWLINRKAAGPNHSVKALREESERFREQVNDHFVETAELINQLTDSYKKVFDHLSDGAERLVDEKVIRERMPEVSDQEIRLKRIGQTSSRASQPADKDQASAASAPSKAASSESDKAQGRASSAEASDKDSSDSGRKVPEAPVNAVGERKSPEAASAAQEKAADATQSKSPSSEAGRDGQPSRTGTGKDASSGEQGSDKQKAAADGKNGSSSGQQNESDSTKRGAGSSSS
jgi:uncharacterized membrane-anchored protein YhcB (DUF1043 family)